MLVLILKTNPISLKDLDVEISRMSQNLQVEKRKKGIRLQLAGYLH